VPFKEHDFKTFKPYTDPVPSNSPSAKVRNFIYLLGPYILFCWPDCQFVHIAAKLVRWRGSIVIGDAWRMIGYFSTTAGLLVCALILFWDFGVI